MDAVQEFLTAGLDKFSPGTSIVRCATRGMRGTERKKAQLGDLTK